jgi:hypothetical protein
MPPPATSSAKASTGSAPSSQTPGREGGTHERSEAVRPRQGLPARRGRRSQDVKTRGDNQRSRERSRATDRRQSRWPSVGVPRAGPTERGSLHVPGTREGLAPSRETDHPNNWTSRPGDRLSKPSEIARGKTPANSSVRRDHRQGRTRKRRRDSQTGRVNEEATSIGTGPCPRCEAAVTRRHNLPPHVR